MGNKFYITTAIAYTNAGPHIGHALEFIQADVVVRYHRLLGEETFFLTGTDEHGTKIARAAAAAGEKEQDFVDRIAVQFVKLDKDLNISNDGFIRTTDKERHWPAVVKLWKKLEEKRDLYKKTYKGLYCSGCEAFLRKSEVVDGRCVIHKTEPDKVSEENWFFKLPKYKKEIKNKIESGELKIVPEIRKKEILNLLDDAEDVSFSRPSKDLRWGIPVPGDDNQTMYVWADALTNYISAIGYEQETEQFKKFWPADVHLIGKDILRFHALYWPAMLMAIGLELPKAIYVHGFITVDGEKMSKSIGNVVDPFALINKYGAEVARYFLIREIPSGEDGNFSYAKLEERYNGDLANGLGNLVQRIITLIESKINGELIFKKELLEKEVEARVAELFKKYRESIDNFQLHEALGNVWELVSLGDKYMDDKKPWVAIKHDEAEFLKIMTNLVSVLYNVAWMLLPFMPETADKIFEALSADKKAGTLENYKFKIKKSEGLFPRIK